MQIEISEEQLNKAIEASINKLFHEDNYNNPLKSFIEKAVGTGYSKGVLSDQINEKIVSKINSFMETSDFDIMLGQAIAKAIATREITKDKK